MDSKCFNTSQASDLDQMAISPETVWGHLSSFPPAKARSAQYTRPKMEADEESPAIWRRVLRSPDHRSSQMGAPGNSLYQIETNSPLISGRSPAESATKGSAEYPMKDDGNDPGHMRAVSVGSHDSLGVGQSDQTPRAVSWPHMSDMSSRKGCDDIHAPSAQGIIPNPDWYRYGSPNLSQYRGHAQRFASVGGEPLIESQCSGIGMIPQCHSYSPTQITRSQNVSQENQVEICPGPQQPLYLRVKQNGQAFPAHYRPQTGSESQSYNLYGNHSVYTPIYTVSPENAAPRATMQHSQIKYSQNQRSASTPAYSTPWEGTSSGSQGKIFTCQQQGCGKSFKRAEHLNRHRRMHTGERPFACSEPGCDRRFSRTDNLAAHKKIHRKGKSELSSHSPLMPSQAGDAENEAGSTDPQIDHTCPGSSSPASHNMGNDVSPGAASATRGEVDSGSSRNTAPPRSDCGASDADTDHSPLADRSVAQEISPVSQQLFNSHLQSPRKITTSHDRNGPGVQPSPHPHQIPGYQKSLPRIQQDATRPPLYTGASSLPLPFQRQQEATGRIGTIDEVPTPRHPTRK